MKLALVGAGARGMIYSRYAHDVLGDEIVAVPALADLRIHRRAPGPGLQHGGDLLQSEHSAEHLFQDREAAVRLRAGGKAPGGKQPEKHLPPADGTRPADL